MQIRNFIDSTSIVLTTLNNTDEFQDLFRYISKNHFIADFIATIEMDNPKQAALLEAIQLGDSNHTIFEDPDCNLYLLSLIKNNKISFHVGMTVYFYLLTLMQFTEKQKLKSEDSDVKLIRQIKIENLSKDKKLTIDGEKFLLAVFIHLKDQGHKMSYSALVNLVLHLAPTEQWLIKIPHFYSYKKHTLHDLDQILIPLAANIPFIYDPLCKSQYECWIPSVSFMDTILQTIFSHPIKMKFCFSTINSLRKSHEQDTHPVSLYGLNVKSNPKIADGYRCGPVGMWLHDVGHTYWGSMLSKDERVFIFNEFIPQLELLVQIAESYHDEGVVAQLKSAINKAIDFDLTAIQEYRHFAIRLSRYLARSFGQRDQSLYSIGRIENDKQVEFQKIGEPTSDRTYFLLKKMYYELPDGKIKQTWKSMFLEIQTGEYFRETEVINSLKYLAYHSVSKSIDAIDNECKNSSESFQKISWQELANKIDDVEDSESLWKLLKKRNEIHKLIQQGFIILFPPYLSMTAEMIDTFKQLVNAKAQEELALSLKSKHVDFRNKSRSIKKF